MARAVMLASHHTIMDLTVEQINNRDSLKQLMTHLLEFLV